MVLSFHKPESLYAEVALLGLSLVIFLYRLCGGTNEWLKTHGVILCSYYAFGSLILDELEGSPNETYLIKDVLEAMEKVSFDHKLPHPVFDVRDHQKMSFEMFLIEVHSAVPCTSGPLVHCCKR